MNELFVNIKVDREERPDIDAIYMRALHALGEQGGWPLTMFLDSEARPFWGGTYFPPAPRYGRPAFADGAAAHRRGLSRRARQGRATTPRPCSPTLAEARGSERRRRPSDDDAATISTSAWCSAVDPVHGGLRARRSFRSGASSGCCGAAPSATARRGRARRRQRRSPTSARAASTIIWAAASRATRSMSAGSSRTSRRCSTTTRC